MPRYASQEADKGVPTTLERDRYQQGQYPSPVEGSVPLAISPTGKTIPIQVTPEGYLQVYNEGSSGAGGDVEQHQEGDSDSNVYGVAVLGDDGTYLHILKIDADGKLQVASDTDVVQYQSGAAETTPIGTVALGYDGSDVRAVAVDANGYLQVSGASDVKSNTLGSVADITLTHAAATQIIAADVTVRTVAIENLVDNTDTMRIGDSNVGASRGIPLAPGETISISTTDTIYGYNPGSTDQAVAIMVTKD